ncbi:MAG TPA: TRAP transporter small permease subunit [Aurantimonas sp.]|uniref:TRAP transporter small permease subunit n=1 Tax=Aurantimonas marianensis TaxID=2920428 RepID=UPI002FB95BBE
MRRLAAYVRFIDRVNGWVGLVTMYSIFAMIGILFYSTITKTFFLPSLWTLEMAQFAMVAYFLVGGGYSLKMGAHVRMDLAYGRWSPRTQASVDAVTILLLIFYLGILLYGGISSTAYALEYSERSYSSWRPYMAPIKIVMVCGIVLMLLQAIAMLIRNVAEARGIVLPGVERLPREDELDHPRGGEPDEAERGAAS